MVMIALVYLLAVNLVSVALFAWDKHCAIEDARRIPEATLLGWALLGGAIGAKCAQQAFRHKTRKQPFGRHLNLYLVLNLAGFGLLLMLSV